MILGDNIFHGQNIPEIVSRCARLESGAIIFGYPVRDPERYGVVDFDKSGNVLSIEEKPEKPRSHYAVPGLYFYDNDVVEIASKLQPSSRGELEITDINLEYLKQDKIRVELLGRGHAWFDTGTHESLQQAASYVQAIQDRQGLKVACIEEVAFRMGYIDPTQLRRLAGGMMKNDFGRYLLNVVEEK